MAGSFEALASVYTPDTRLSLLPSTLRSILFLILHYYKTLKLRKFENLEELQNYENRRKIEKEEKTI